MINTAAIKAMLERSAEKKTGRFSFAITTNGTCSSDENLSLLEKGNFEVILSIDGPPRIHDECRQTISGSPSHATVLSFLRSLRARTHCWVRGSAVVRSGWSLAQASAYLRSLPVDVIKAQAIRAAPGSPYTLSASEKLAYLKDLADLGHQVIAELEAGQRPRDDRFNSRVLQLLARKKRTSFCGAGEIIFGINPSGFVLPCVLMDAREGTFGHISDDSSTWITAGQKWRKSRSVRTECKSCSVFHLCGGGCPAVLPICGSDECDIVRKECEVSMMIFEHFRSRPESLLAMAGIT